MKNNNNFTNIYDLVKTTIESNNARKAFDLLEGDFVGMGEYEYSDAALTIMELVKKHGEGFVVDICTRVLDSIFKGGKVIALSTKQQWCVAFALLKIDAAQVDELRAADQALAAEEDAQETTEENTAEAADTEEPEATRTIYRVQYTRHCEASPILETSDREAAEAEFAKQHDDYARNTPADTSGWGDSDQAWSNVFYIELIRIVLDEDGDIVDEETLAETPYYYF